MEKHIHIFIYKALGERKKIGATTNKYFTRRSNSECKGILFIQFRCFWSKLIQTLTE